MHIAHTWKINGERDSRSGQLKNIYTHFVHSLFLGHSGSTFGKLFVNNNNEPNNNRNQIEISHLHMPWITHSSTSDSSVWSINATPYEMKKKKTKKDFALNNSPSIFIYKNLRRILFFRVFVFILILFISFHVFSIRLYGFFAFVLHAEPFCFIWSQRTQCTSSVMVVCVLCAVYCVPLVWMLVVYAVCSVCILFTFESRADSDKTFQCVFL